MKRKRKLRSLTQVQRNRREFEPKRVDDCVVNGCVPQDDYSEQIFEELESGAISFGTVWERGEMPILKMDENFRKWRSDSIEQCKALVAARITCLLPWQILKNLSAYIDQSIL